MGSKEKEIAKIWTLFKEIHVKDRNKNYMKTNIKVGQ